MAEYTLYCFAQSGNAYKAGAGARARRRRLGAALRRLFRRRDAHAGLPRDQRDGRGAVLEHRGATLSQSGVILDYLAERSGASARRDDAERREILRWLLCDNHKLTSYTATYRFMRAFAKDADPAVMADSASAREAAWGVLDAHLDGRRFVVGDRLTIADLSLCGYLFLPTRSASTGTAYPQHCATGSRGSATSRAGCIPTTLMPGHPRPAAQ